ncbi:glycosyltransferase [Leucobacter sp. USHLN153]|uniref:glycosyltransferase n=1 Tax=Leucobacter sp. USHLN153 TaxID=3081268 RepID=UPI0030199517
MSYANDEPVDEILEAARLVPALEWILTGEPPEAVRAAAPPNVTFAGFVSDSEYERLIRSVAGVCALTTRAHTMQRAGYEAFNFGVPQVTSDFSELRDFYGESALYTASDAEAIAAAARSLADRREELRRRVLELRPQRIAEQRRALARLTLMLHGSGSRDLAHGKGA